MDAEEFASLPIQDRNRIGSVLRGVAAMLEEYAEDYEGRGILAEVALREIVRTLLLDPQLLLELEDDAIFAEINKCLGTKPNAPP